MSSGGGQHRASLDENLVNSWKAKGATTVAEGALSVPPCPARQLEEALALAALPCSQLLRLVERKREPMQVRSAIYYPLNASLEREGRSSAADGLNSYVGRTVSGATERVHLAIDSWGSGSSFVEIASILGQLDLPNVEVIGPSTAEIRGLMEESDLDRILTILHLEGISRISGGTHIEIHRAAARYGFESMVGYDISFLVHGALPKVSRPARRALYPEVCETTLLLERVIGDLLDLRSDLGSSLRGLFFWVPDILDPRLGTATLRTVEGILRIVAVSRLLLPERILISTPLRLLGVELAQAVLLFGANDLGLLAFDGESARLLGLPRAREAIEIQHLVWPADERRHAA